MRSLLVLLALFAGSNAIGQEASNSPSKETQQQVSAVFDEIKALVEQQDFAKAMALMTDEAADRFVAERLFDAADLSNEMKGSRVGKKIAAVNAEIGISFNLIPKEIYSGNVESEEEYDKLTEKTNQDLRDAVGDRQKQCEALKKLFDTFKALPADSGLREVMYHSFEGELQEIVGGDENVTVVAKGEYEDDFLNFTKTKDGWRFNGGNDEMYMAAMDAPLELIDNIKLAGETVEKTRVNLADFKGNVVLVDFWGTWCGPCVAELPSLKKIYAGLHEHGFEIIGVAQDDSKSLNRFFKNEPLPWSNIVDAEGQISREFGVNAFPTTLLINQDGEHYASDLFGVELLDEVIKQLEVNPKDFKTLRGAIANADQHADQHAGTTPGGDGYSNGDQPAVGFEVADTSGDQSISAKELRKYLRERLEDKLPHRKIFTRLDKDKSGGLSEAEFESRHQVIEQFMGPGYFSGGQPDPKDPGKEFVPFRGLAHSIDDRDVFGAVFHRYQDELSSKKAWPMLTLDSLDPSVTEPAPSPEFDNQSSVSDLVKATVIMAGGGDAFFTAGAVMISKDGLAVTNYHVIEGMSEMKMVGLTHDGKTHRMIEVLAGDRDKDVALIRLEGSDFTHVRIAAELPKMGDDLVMVHHSENRFFTYDRGYVMRYPVVGKNPWLEVSMDYAPGGSGCGIYNKNHELVGIVSSIVFGDGPSIADPFIGEEESSDDSQKPSDDDYFEEAVIMVKQAVALPSIQSLWSQETAKAK